MANLNLHGDVNRIEKMVYKSYHDILTFGKMFLPGDFMNKAETPEFHHDIAKELNSPSNKPAAFLLPRDSAKTTLTKAKILHDFCYAKKAFEWGWYKKPRNLFFGWASDSQNKSKKNVGYIRLNLKRNEFMNYIFGNGKDNMMGEVDNQEDITTCYEDRLISSSNLTSMRGDTMASLDEGAVRYSGVFIDDAESEKNTITENARDKIIDNIMNGIMPAIISNEPYCRMFISGTPVHYASFVQKLLDGWIEACKKGGCELDPLVYTKDKMELARRAKVRGTHPFQVTAYRTSQPDLQGGVLWHDYKPRSLLDEIQERYVSVGRPSGFYQEYELEVQHEDQALFGQKVLKYHDLEYLYERGVNYIVDKDRKIPVLTFAGCDPATDIDRKNSDFSVILVLAVDINNNIYVLHYERHRSIPTIGMRNADGTLEGKKGVVDFIVELNDRFHLSRTTIEDVAMTRSVFQALNSYKRSKNRYDIHTTPAQPGTTENKHDRIYSRLVSPFSMGVIYIKEDMHALIQEIIKLGPSMAHDDTIESLYYAILHARPPRQGELVPGSITGERDGQVPTPTNWQAG